MASALDLQTQTTLAYQWLASNSVDFQGTCSLLHNGSCTIDNIIKSGKVGKVGMKYYISFHLIPLILRLRKCKDKQQAIKLLGRSIVEYVRSVLFITFLVGGMKVGQCMTVQSRVPYLEGSIAGFGMLSALSIFFEQSSRRQQIGYFVAAKALRSSYKGLKRMKILSIKRQFLMMQVLIMSAIYYVYCHHPQLLKFRNIFQVFLGD